MSWNFFTTAPIFPSKFEVRITEVCVLYANFYDGYLEDVPSY